MPHSLFIGIWGHQNDVVEIKNDFGWKITYFLLRIRKRGWEGRSFQVTGMTQDLNRALKGRWGEDGGFSVVWEVGEVWCCPHSAGQITPSGSLPCTISHRQDPGANCNPLVMQSGTLGSPSWDTGKGCFYGRGRESVLNPPQTSPVLHLGMRGD